jgi:hypothetical protein
MIVEMTVEGVAGVAVVGVVVEDVTDAIFGGFKQQKL